VRFGAAKKVVLSGRKTKKAGKARREEKAWVCRSKKRSGGGGLLRKKGQQFEKTERLQRHSKLNTNRIMKEEKVIKLGEKKEGSNTTRKHSSNEVGEDPHDTEKPANCAPQPRRKSQKVWEPAQPKARNSQE